MTSPRLENEKKVFYQEFESLLQKLESDLQTADGLWTLRGFIDTARQVYSLGPDTKVISKALELMLLPPITHFWATKGYQVIPARYQNFYPDLSLVSPEQQRLAVDLKTCYRLLDASGRPTGRVSGFTLGAFTGYFRNRQSTKNVTLPYGSYQAHFVVGLVYSQAGDVQPGIYDLDQLTEIVPPIRDIQIFFHEKWRLASDRPGSGNTRNIGSVTNLADLQQGTGPFTRLGKVGKQIFDEYWQQYLNRDMARAAELSEPPFRNLREYLIYRNRPDLLALLEQQDAANDF